MTSKDDTQEVSSGIKDYTSDIPMFGLEEVIKFVTKIHESGLETASMSDVAKGCGYSNASSTPFYRRVVAARLFGLLSKTGPELSIRATNYLKPDLEDARPKALVEAVTGIPIYSDTVQKFRGKKLNVDLVANGFEKQLKLSAACAKICAKAFENSIRFAGLIDRDSLVQQTPSAPASEGGAPSLDSGIKTPQKKEEAAEVQTHTIFLDTAKRRKFTVMAPLDITPAELKRIEGWLGFALLVTSPTHDGGNAEPGA